MAIEFKSTMSERIIIGILINHPEYLLDTKGLKFKHFWDRCHRTVFHVLNRLFIEGFDNIDSLSILARAEKIKDASDIINDSGGLEYLEYIKELVSDYTLQDMHKHIEIIKTNAYKREQEEQKELFLRELRNREDWSISDINNWLQEKQYALQSEYSMSGEAKPIGDMFDETWSKIEENRGQGGIVGYPSKIPKINEYFTYRKGELVVIGARAKYIWLAV